MRSMLSLALGAVLVLTLGAGSVLAAKPDNIHISETGNFEIPDYCGTGVALEIAFTSVRNVWFGEDFERVTYQTKYTVTAATSDEVLVRTESGQNNVKVFQEVDGGFTVISSGAGTPERIKWQHGGLLTRDAGLIVVTDHFDADWNYLGSDVAVRGPHPDLESDFELQCQVTTEALNM